MTMPPKKAEGLSEREQQTRLRAAAFFIIGLPIVGYGVSAGIAEDCVPLTSLGLLTAVAVSIGAFLLWHKKGGYGAIRPGIACHTILTLYLVAYSGTEHARSLWFLTVPLISIMLLPPREGTTWSVGAIAIACGLMFQAGGLENAQAYSSVFIVRYTVLGLMISGVLCWSEVLLERYQIRLQQQNAALKEERDHLENEIIRRGALEEELRYLATTDSLTGLLNRRAFMAALAGELTRSHRMNTPLTVLMIDIDHFKQINDKLGHPAGDAVLIHLSALLQEQLRSIDKLGRIGGEEFAIMLVDTPADAADIVVRRLLDAIRSRPAEHPESHRPITFTASIGCTERHPNDDELTSLSRADRALYAAKQDGRDRHHWI